MLRAFIVSSLVLFAVSVPCAAAKRSVHLFTEPYVFDFSRDYKFVKRIDQQGAKRDTVVFFDGNKSIAISASIYDPASTAKLMSREAYTAKMTSENATAIKYINEETPDGRLGSHLLGACDRKNCFYKMQSVVDQKIWLSIAIMCDDCSKDDMNEVSALADRLYQQLKGF